MSNDSHRQGHLPPPPWTAGQPDYPPSSQYPATTQPPYQYQPPPPPPPPGMATIQHHLQHPQPDAYRLPHPAPYQRPPEMYAPPTAPPVPPIVYPPAAPRQRTAIACRYCRRRKIRCSGFDTSQEGRCSNCVRFNQECMFTPVSSQTQAFVPAHAAYPHLRNVQAAARMPGRPGEGVMLYGAHGQPLPPPQAPIPHGQENTLPPPAALYQPPQSPYGIPGPGPQGPPPPLAHPPMLHDPRASQGRRESGTGYDTPILPPVSAPTSGVAYQSHPAPVGTFYSSGPQDTRRLSSHSAYSFDQSHNPPPAANISTPSLPFPLQPPSQSSSTPKESGPTPPPGQGSATRRSGLSVTEMLVPTEPQNTRSDTDNRMVNALDRRGLSK